MAAADAGATPQADVSPARGARPTGARRAGLFVLAFASGFAVLTIELAGARLIAPVYGLSAVPWTAVIGVILAALALGSHVGGRLADGGRVPLSAVLLVAAFTGALPILGSGVPWLAREGLGFIPGAVATALVLFAPSVLCLGAVVPYLVQADTESLGRVGRRAGDMSAAATAGSIVGSFTTGFVLLPAFPVTVLLGLTAAGLMALAWLSGWILGRRAPGELLALGAVGLGVLGAAAARPGPDTLFETQTLYASVQVTERVWDDGRLVRELWQNGGSSSAEYVDTGDPAHVYVDVSGLVLEPVIEDIHSLLVLGGAALSLPVAFQRWRPDMRIDVVEIDPVVTAVARAHFSYGKADYPNIRVTHDDARVFLRGSDRRWNAIYLDVFDHLLTVPWTVVTVEALTEMADHLEPGGLLVANVLSPLSGPGVGFLQRFRATLGEVFPEVRVYVTDPGRDPAAIQNLIVVAGKDPSALPDVAWPQAAPGPAGRPLTDAWAPVEYLQAKVFLGGVRWN
jgi:predicted membrane-bound spermidine synthase